MIAPLSVAPLGSSPLRTLVFLELSVDIMTSPWEKKQHIERLAFLPDRFEGHVPPGQNYESDEYPLEFLETFREYARWYCDAELIDDRKDLWAKDVTNLEDMPEWVTLQPHPELKHWKDILLEDLEMDPRSLQNFVRCVRRGPHGYQEGCKLLAHLLFYKSLKESWVPTTASCSSSWMQRASAESLDAFDNPELWEQGPDASLGPAKGGSKASSSSSGPWASYQPTSASSSSDTGKGAGKGYHKGIR